MRKSDCKWTGIKITTSNSSIEMRDGNTWRGSGTGKFRKGAGSGMVDVGTEINDGNGREIAVGNETSHIVSRSRPDLYLRRLLDEESQNQHGRLVY